MGPPEVGPRRSPGLWGPEEVRWGQVQVYSPALRGALRSGAYGSEQVRRYEVSRQPWDPMDPPEVGPRRSPGLSGRVRPGGVKYRAARLRYVALCR